jgi:prolyl oligopeptidase
MDQTKDLPPGGSTLDPNDPYQWLEVDKGSEALAWAARRTAEAKAVLTKAPLYPELKAELDALIKAGGPAPTTLFLGGRLARVLRDGDHPRGVLELAEQTEGGPLTWRPIFDVEALNRAEGKAYDVHWGFLSKMVRPSTYDRCLMPLSPGGGDEAELREFDLVKGAFVDGGFIAPASKVAAVWLDDNRLLISHTVADAPRLAGGGGRNAQIWDRGSPLESAPIVLEMDATDSWMMLNAAGSGAERRAIITRIHDFSTFSFVVVDQDGTVSHAVLPRAVKPYGVLGVSDRHFFVQLAEPADIAGRSCPAESIIAYDISASTEEFERASVVYTFGLDEFANDVMFGFACTKSALHFVADRRLRRRLMSAYFTASGWEVKESYKAPAGVTLKMGIWNSAGSPAADALWLEQTGFLTPTRIDLLVSDQPGTLLHTDRPVIDAAKFVVEIHQATSRDGTEVDYYLLRSREGGPPGAVPTLMTGYGAFGMTISPTYFDYLLGGLSLALWLDRGGALAMPIIRGGGERGAAWHAAALRENRQRSYDDFIAAAEHLISSGFTTAGHLGVFGASNGGLLAATVSVQRPDLFGAVVSDAPVLDMMRYHKLGAGGGMLGEYGDSDDPVVREAILGYSPYQNLRAGHAYPPFLLTVSTEDDRVGPGHARKFAARASELGAEAMLIEEAEGGHAVSNSMTRPDLMAMRMAFLIDRLMINRAPQ